MKIDLVQLQKELDTLDGKPPHDKLTNPAWNDPYFARSLEVKYGRSLADLRATLRGDKVPGPSSPQREAHMPKGEKIIGHVRQLDLDKRTCRVRLRSGDNRILTVPYVHLDIVREAMREQHLMQFNIDSACEIVSWAILGDD